MHAKAVDIKLMLLWVSEVATSWANHQSAAANPVAQMLATCLYYLARYIWLLDSADLFLTDAQAEEAVQALVLILALGCATFGLAETDRAVSSHLGDCTFPLPTCKRLGWQQFPDHVRRPRAVGVAGAALSFQTSPKAFASARACYLNLRDSAIHTPAVHMCSLRVLT